MDTIIIQERAFVLETGMQESFATEMEAGLVNPSQRNNGARSQND